MTAETLKPFITPNGVDLYPSAHPTKIRQLSTSIVTIALTATCITLAIVMMSVTIWNTVRISKLETEMKTINDVVKNMQNRLGLHYLDDINEFEKEYSNALFDNPASVDNVDSEDEEDVDADDDDDDDNTSIEDEDEDDDDDDVDEGLEYDELIQKLNEYEDNDDENNDDYTSSNVSGDDNLYDDYQVFKDSIKKQSSTIARDKRAIANASNGLPIHETSFMEKLNKTEQNAPLNELEKSSQVHDAQQATTHHRKKPVMRSHPENVGVSQKSEDKRKRYFVSEKRDERRYSPLRQQGHNRRRKFPIVKSGDSLISAKSTAANLETLPPAAHFHLNRKVPDHRSAFRVNSYSGDMYIGSPSWSNNNAYEQYFFVENGVLTVRVPGIYYIYAQVCYNNSHDQNGFVIFHGHKPYLQCLNTVPTNMPMKIHTCHTSGLIYLGANDTIHLRDFHSDRNAVLKDTNNRSYFGLIKI